MNKMFRTFLIVSVFASILTDRSIAESSSSTSRTLAPEIHGNILLVDGSESQSYPIPVRVKNADGKQIIADWTYLTPDHAVARENDPKSPYIKFFANISPKAAGADAALQAAIQAAKVDQPIYGQLHETKIAETLVGSKNLFLLGQSQLGGQDAILFAQVFQTSSDSRYSVRLIEADAKTYKAWGGIAAMAAATGVIDHPNEIPEKYRNQLAFASLDQQMAFYHMAYTKVMESYFAGFVAANTGTLTMMQNINYDLLFNGEITLDSLDTVP
ncbi:MAG: hypothetical protein AAFQ80_13785 [Cyanobacteria bacterium J06621_8]